MVPPFTADTVTESPTCAPGTVNAGAESFVRLSVFDVPVSFAGSRSGADAEGAVVSMVTGVDGPADEMFPAGSVSVAEVDQVPSERAGRSHEVAGRMYEHVFVVVPLVAVIVMVSPDAPPVADIVGVSS